MRYTGPKNKISRREKVDLGFKTVGSKAHANLLKKITIGPGQHGGRSRRKVSERGRQLREKQKLRFMFGVSERQLSNYFSKAVRTKGNTADYLVQLLEKRLDNIIYRLNFAPTRAAARQLVNHNHFKVNGGVVNIPSYQVKPNDIITFANEKSVKIPVVETALSQKDYVLPNWLERKSANGRIVSEPLTDDIAKQINLRLVIEFYSK